MTAAHTLGQLRDAGNLLARAIASLEAFDAAPGAIATTLAAASALLQSVDVAALQQAGPASVATQLHELSRRAHNATTLLESAAALHFGRVLHAGINSGGYTSDGSVDRVASRGFRIEA